MHKILLRLIALAALATSGAHAQEIDLFNGIDLTGWEGLPRFWSVQDGAITGKLDKSNTNGAENNYLIWQGGKVADFELSCRYKLTPHKPENWVRASVAFRATYMNQAKYQLHGYEGMMGSSKKVENPAEGDLIVNRRVILNGRLMEDGGPVGNLSRVGRKVVIHFAPAPPNGRAQGRIEVVGSLASDAVYETLYHPNDWNDYKISAVGNHIQIFVNGQQTVDVIDELNRSTTGLIGLQLHCFSDQPYQTVQFKDIKLHVIKGDMAAPAAPTVTAKSGTTATEANLPRIEVLRDQAPNATEWALAPLDRPLPPDIRKSLTYLREDLLDEGKAKPKAGPAAYALAAQLCDRILAIIAERGETSARAGYSAAQANADVQVTSQALEARRNYKMSWTQYRRENAQRAEIRREQLSEADLKKERAKVDWAARSAVLRDYMDGLYAQFRAALRQPPAAK